MAPVKLGYWNIRGLAAPLRMLLSHSGVEYEDVVYKVTRKEDGSLGSDWGAVKWTLGLDYPNLPYLIDGDFKLTESHAIARYVGEKYNPKMVGSTPEEKARIECLMSVVADFRSALVKGVYGSAETLAEFKANAPKKQLKGLAKTLQQKKFLNGDQPCIADFFFYELAYEISFLLPELYKEDDFSSIPKYLDSVRSLPGVDKFLASESFIGAKHFNNIVAVWEGPETEPATRG